MPLRSYPTACGVVGGVHGVWASAGAGQEGELTPAAPGEGGHDAARWGHGAAENLLHPLQQHQPLTSTPTAEPLQGYTDY